MSNNPDTRVGEHRPATLHPAIRARVRAALGAVLGALVFLIAGAGGRAFAAPNAAVACAGSAAAPSPAEPSCWSSAAPPVPEPSRTLPRAEVASEPPVLPSPSSPVRPHTASEPVPDGRPFVELLGGGVAIAVGVIGVIGLWPGRPTRARRLTSR